MRSWRCSPASSSTCNCNVRTVKDAVVVPVAAVRHGGTGDYVFVLNDDRTVALRPVTRGQATVDKVQIATGLQVGERVITEGADRLRDGSRVMLPGDTPRRRAAAPAPPPSGARRRRARARADRAPHGRRAASARAAAAPRTSARGAGGAGLWSRAQQRTARA